MATPAPGNPTSHLLSLVTSHWPPANDEDLGFQAILTFPTTTNPPHSKQCGTHYAIATYAAKISSHHLPPTMHHHEPQHPAALMPLLLLLPTTKPHDVTTPAPPTPTHNNNQNDTMGIICDPVKELHQTIIDWQPEFDQMIITAWAATLPPNSLPTTPHNPTAFLNQEDGNMPYPPKSNLTHKP